MSHADSPGQELQQLRDAVRRQPGDFIGWLMLADAEMSVAAFDAAAQALRRAHTLRGDHPETLARMGRLHWMRGHHAQAITLLGQAAALAPRHPGISLWLGHALEDAGEAEPAAQAYAAAHRLLPDEPHIAAQYLNWCRRLCDWDDLDALSLQVRQAVAQGRPGVEPFAFLSEDSSAAEQLACARLRAMPLARIRPLPSARLRTHGSLRLGFLSNGFGAHPTGLLTVALFEALRAQPAVEAHLFALNRDDSSEIRRRLAAATSLHSVVGRPHREVALAIRQAGIDLLFDLRGWGGGGTPEVLALRPAPVQLNWLAYPGTSGAPWVDYVVGDVFALPQWLERHYSEKVLRLPRAFQPSDTRREVALPPSREDCGLPVGGVVFCCFNNSYKLNPRSFARLLAVLRGVPGSALWLLSGPGHANARLRTAAEAAGVAPQRLIFAPKLSHPAYLARYRHADLFLDTEPYNAHTTASDALWAGCPVLTTPGGTFAARVAGSLNHHLGMGVMNVVDDAAFIARAIALGNAPDELASLRAELAARRRTSGLFDMDGFAADFAALAAQVGMHHGWQGN